MFSTKSEAASYAAFIISSNHSETVSNVLSRASPIVSPTLSNHSEILSNISSALSAISEITSENHSSMADMQSSKNIPS